MMEQHEGGTDVHIISQGMSASYRGEAKMVFSAAQHLLVGVLHGLRVRGLTVAPAALAARITSRANPSRYRQYPSQCSHAQRGGSQSAGRADKAVSSVDAPSAVRMVRWPSGVTCMRASVAML